MPSSSGVLMPISHLAVSKWDPWENCILVWECPELYENHTPSLGWIFSNREHCPWVHVRLETSIQNIPVVNFLVVAASPLLAVINLFTHPPQKKLDLKSARNSTLGLCWASPLALQVTVRMKTCWWLMHGFSCPVYRSCTVFVNILCYLLKSVNSD